MLFNSLAFLVFLPTVFAVYWLIYCPNGDGSASRGRIGDAPLPLCSDERQSRTRQSASLPPYTGRAASPMPPRRNIRLHLQNLFVVAASYVFYGWWDWKFLLLITFTSLWAWASGLAIARFPAKGRLTVALALVVAPLVLVEWFNRGRDVPRLPQGKALRWLVYAAFAAFILWNKPEPQAFIYFQF